MKNLIAVCLGILLFSGLQAHADTPTFNNLNSTDFNNIMKDLSAYSSYDSVSGPAGRGNIFGFEVGIVGGETQTPNLNTVVQQNSPNTTISQLPTASILAGVSLLDGLSFEVMFMPTLTLSNLSYSQYGGAIQYRIIDMPIALSVKGHFNKTMFNYSQTVNNSSTNGQNVNVTVNFDNTLIGGDLLAGLDLPLVEPYVGLGYETANANLGVTGATNATIYSPSFTSGQSANSTPSSVRFLVGVELKLAIMRLGAEYLNAYGTSRIDAKLSFGF